MILKWEGGTIMLIYDPKNECKILEIEEYEMHDRIRRVEHWEINGEYETFVRDLPKYEEGQL